MATSILNKAYGGQGLRSHFATTTCLETTDSYVCIFGTSHTIPFHKIFTNWQTGSGFEDRWLVTVYEGDVPDYNASKDVRQKQKKTFDRFEWMKLLFDHFQSREDINILVFSKEAEETYG